MSVRLRSRSYLGSLSTFAVLVMAVSCGGGGGGEPTGPDRTVSQITLTPATPSVIAGQSVTLTAQPRNAAGDALSGQTVVWSSSDATIATVANGVVTAVKAGGATISASSGSVTASTTVTVLPAVAQVVVSPSPAEVVLGSTVTLTAALSDASGAPITGRTVVWTSSSDAAGSVSPAGVVTGKAVGAVLITATIEGKSGSATVNVRPVPVASVTVSPNPLTIPFGGSGSFTFDAKDAAGNSLGGRSVTWSSDNELVATVSATGAVTTKGVGSTTVHATVEGKVGNATVTVTGEPVASIAVTPTPTSVEAGQTTTLSTTVKDGAGNTLNGRNVIWTTSDGSKATVTAGANGTGVVKGVAVGTVTITATSEGKSGTATVDVVDTQDPVLLSLTIVPSTVNVSGGPASVVFTAHLTDGSGIARFDVRAASPVVGAPPLSCLATAPASGTANDGTFTCTITVPQGAPSGDWTLTIGALDSSPAGRSLILTSSSLASMGITPSKLTVQ